MLASVIKLRLESNLQIAVSVVVGIVFPVFCSAVLSLCVFYVLCCFYLKNNRCKEKHFKNLKYIAWQNSRKDAINLLCSC